MFDSIIALLKDLWKDYLQFWTYIRQYEEGLILRNGKFKRMLCPGYHWKIPWIEEAFDTLMIPTTIDLKLQTLVTKDGKVVTVRGMVKSRTEDAKKFLLEVYDQNDALGDTTMGIIAKVVSESTLEELLGVDIDKAITTKARVAAKKYGIYIEQVTLIEKAPSISIRTYSDVKPEGFTL